MNIIQVVETLGLTMIKMAVIWGSCGIGLVVIAQLLKAVDTSNIENVLKKIFN